MKAKDSLLNQTGNKLNARDSVDVARDNEIDNGNALFSRSSELSENKEDDAVLRTGDGLLNQIDGVVLEKDVVIVEVDNELFIVSAQDYNKILSEEKRFEVRDYVPRIVRPYYDHITLIANNLYQRFSNKSDSLVANLGHKISISINGVRKNFDGDYRTASSVDESVRFHNMSDLINYLPRALQIGLFAPFPDQWLEPGSSEPNTIMRKVAIFEMSFFYLSLVFLLLNIKWVLRNPGILYILLVSVSAIVFYSYFMSNIGTLYRMRFAFHILICAISVGALLKYIFPDSGKNLFTVPLAKK